MTTETISPVLPEDPTTLSNDELEKLFGSHDLFQVGFNRNHPGYNRMDRSAQKRIRCTICNVLMEIGEFYIATDYWKSRVQGEHLKCQAEAHARKVQADQKFAAELDAQYGITPRAKNYMDMSIIQYVDRVQKELWDAQWSANRLLENEKTFIFEGNNRRYYEARKAEILKDSSENAAALIKSLRALGVEIDLGEEANG